MIYASSRRSAEALAEQQAGLKLAKKVRKPRYSRLLHMCAAANVDLQLEATDPTEITAQTIAEEFAIKQESKSGFAKPKRPGRR
jgi:twinfilin-like protein